ncbi:GMC oxidoreductase [Devosia sp. CN2-171]|uniref:GMC oxidoreductase n=1 Tax=Devosia sp. CN2-171 TaxID=3400909 RepID=UPI003BF7C2C4
MLGSIQDLKSAPDFDLLIVGAGVAGLIIANALDKSPLRVGLLEAGGNRPTAASRRLYEGEVMQPRIHPGTARYRVRAAGGTSWVWGGRCIPFDRIDFEKRDWIDNSGWPIGYDDLAPYYPLANQLLDAGDFSFDPAVSLPDEPAELVAGLDGDAITTTLERFSKPTNVWRKLKGSLAVSTNVSTFLDCPVATLLCDEGGRAATGALVRSPAGEEVLVTAKRVVVCTGGQETPRLLLLSSLRQNAPFGNTHDNVGRYYMTHLCATEAILSAAPDRLAYDYSRDRDGIYLRRRLWINEAAQRQHHLLNVTFRTHLPAVGNPAHHNGVMSAMYFAKHLVKYEYSRGFGNPEAGWGTQVQHARNVILGAPQLLGFSTKWIRKRILAERKLPSVVLPSPQGQYPLEYHAEQSPVRDSRIGLSSSLDAMGLPKLRVDWHLGERDVDQMVGAHALLRAQLERSGAGALTFDEASLRQRLEVGSVVGGHHIGTTRMSANPQEGVVDLNCRVHDMSNLYIAGSSTFATSGQANPTLTIVALALRLAEHLRAS